MIRIDKQLEANQVRRELEVRFKVIYNAFTPADYLNPVTNKTIFEALSNIRKELDATI